MSAAAAPRPRRAALIIAASGWRADCVDNWDGGQYEVELAVPAELYDVAGDEAVHVELASAAEAVIGSGHYRGLTIALKHASAPDGWDKQIAQEIIDAARARQQRPAPLEP